MNIIFLTISKFLDVEASGIYTDLMRKFRDEGHDVYILSPRERRLNMSTNLEKVQGIHILGVKTLNVTKVNVVEKGIGMLLLEKQFQSAIKKYLETIKFDLILYSTPPITFPSVIKYLKRKNPSAISYLLLKDIFPQNAVDLGMFSKQSLLYRMFRKKEERMYELSDYIGCMSPANVDFVIRNNPYIDPQTVEVNPNSLELQTVKPIDKTIMRQKYGLPEDRPILIYGGNLGKPQGIDFLIEVLESNANRSDCYFLVVGSGTEYGKLESWYRNSCPKSVKILSALPKEDYDKLVRSCDIGLIFLDRRFTIPNYPSRLLSYLENKMPVLAATDVNTDIGTIAETNGYGCWCESGDLDSFNKKLDNLLKSDLLMMGEKGYSFLKNNYLVEHSYSIIMNHLKSSLCTNISLRGL